MVSLRLRERQDTVDTAIPLQPPVTISLAGHEPSTANPDCLDAPPPGESVKSVAVETATGIGPLAAVVTRYMPLVWHAVRSLVVGGSTTTYLALEDLVSCGVEGLIEAYWAFDPSRGVRFSTYAVPRIRGSILDALRSAHPLPRYLQELASANDNATARLYCELGRTPTHAEVAAHLGLPADRFETSLSASSITVLSLEKLTNRDDEVAATLAELADDDPGIDPDHVAQEDSLRRRVRAAIRRLPDRERRIVRDYYIRARSLESIARDMAISKGRASQLRDRAVRRLRQALV